MSSSFYESMIEIWTGGGWLMIPLAILVIVIYYVLFDTWGFLSRNNFYREDPNAWEHWIDRPEDSQGEIGHILRYVRGDRLPIADMRWRFEEVRIALLKPITRRIIFGSILTGTAPLTGLLGTVAGMLSTFGGLSTGAGGETVDVVAGGISQALITTQAGLIVAIPAYIIIASIKRRRDEMELFLSKLETYTVKRVEHLRK
ncbi:MotA/TolQ/ExbB proton channel family protein [Pelagicoccus albus]|uniref:MotA/TolQ/ExbB proton channel family protein n=1 Tax=Pelagicoccus albus TaxID=415222 RepID=A0A7X1B9S4_9BACT|nr:MotA/TolQ/ExbB proton channel family protein [Pelagicoccus albus]MBC2607959.1 MotA/TolQ/ExbB proton channel family protein [Pelagicoccus albus]